MKILVIPFENRSEHKYNYLEPYVPGYLNHLIKEYTDYQVVSLGKYYDYVENKGFSPKDLKNQYYLNVMATDLKVGFIFTGFFEVLADNNLTVTVDVNKFTSQDIELEDDNFVFILDDKNIANPYLDDFISLFDDGLPATEIKSGVFIFTADAKCRVFINGEEIDNPDQKLIRPLPEGEYQVRLLNEEIGFMHEENITIAKRNTLRLDIKIYTPLSITADKPCWVYLDAEEPQLTPFNTKLITNNDYKIRVEYRNGGQTSHVVWEKHIIARGKPIEHNCSEEGQLLINTHPAFTVILEGQILSCLPYSNAKVLPGNYRVQVLIEDPDRKKKWTFLDKTYEMLPYGTIELNKGDFGYRKNRWLAYIPFASQFYNRQKIKGSILLGLLSGTAVFITYYSIMLDAKNDHIQHASLNDLDRLLREKRNYITNLSLSIISASLVFIYSYTDGIVTSNQILKKIE